MIIKIQTMVVKTEVLVSGLFGTVKNFSDTCTFKTISDNIRLSLKILLELY